MPADSLQKQSWGHAGWLFRKGRSGNPAGRRPGCRNRASLAAEVLREAEALTRKAIELALEGWTRLAPCPSYPRAQPQQKAFNMNESLAA